MNPQEYRCQILSVPGAENVRDIGGYPGEGGRPVQYRRFIRAGGMGDLTEEGVAAVRALGVNCIVDLRSGFEAKKKADTLMYDDTIDYVHIPMLDYIQSNVAEGKVAFPESMTEMYIGLLENDKEKFLRVLQTLAGPAYETVLYHCTAGKDRTGLTTMLLLGLAGVSRADIVEDYSHSEHLTSQKPIPGLPIALFQSRPETMEAALDHLDEKYGGVRPYLAHIGVDEEMKAALLGKLL